jgi:hypothetical protein
MINMRGNPNAQPVTQLAFRLRSLTLALGESVRPQWWTTQFMSEAGMRFLERLYPRTAFQAAVHAAGRAACDAHDRAVGRVGVYHLFRLPESLELDMARIPPDFDNDFVTRFRAGLGAPEKLLVLLAAMCEGVEVETAGGARRIGSDLDSMTLPSLRKVAAIYHHAFAHGKPAFPYFTAEDRK